MFPRNISVEVTYTLKNNSIIISYKAVPGGATPIVLTNHAFFNLDGFGKDIRNHKLQIFADRYTEVNENLIPNGNRPNVAGTNIDFRELRLIDDGSCEFNGYDNNMILSPTSYKSFNVKELGLAAIAENDHLRMKAYTDQPGMQLYTGFFLVTVLTLRTTFLRFSLVISVLKLKLNQIVLNTMMQFIVREIHITITPFTNFYPNRKRRRISATPFHYILSFIIK